MCVCRFLSSSEDVDDLLPALQRYLDPTTVAPLDVLPNSECVESITLCVCVCACVSIMPALSHTARPPLYKYQKRKDTQRERERDEGEGKCKYEI